MIKIKKMGLQNLVVPLHRSSVTHKNFVLFKGFVQSWGGRIWSMRTPYKRAVFTGLPGSNPSEKGGFPGPSAHLEAKL